MIQIYMKNLYNILVKIHVYKEVAPVEEKMKKGFAIGYSQKNHII